MMSDSGSLLEPSILPLLLTLALLMGRLSLPLPHSVQDQSTRGKMSSVIDSARLER
jgi:hypothetical protein